MQTAVPPELCYSMTDPRMPMFAKPLGVASDEMVADKVFILSVLLKHGCQMACLGLFVFGPSGLKDYSSATLRCKI